MGVASGWQYGSETPPAVMIMNLMSSAGGSTHLKIPGQPGPCQGGSPGPGGWVFSQRFFSQSPTRLLSMALDPFDAMAAPARKEVARSCLVTADCLAGR